MAEEKRTTEERKKECVRILLNNYPRYRKFVYKTYDRMGSELTRTQQMIMLALAQYGTMSMSELASKICTSNEQATRAVSKLVDNGYIERFQNRLNRRVVNIRLTASGNEMIMKAREESVKLASLGFEVLTDQDIKDLLNAVETFDRLFEKAENR